MSQATIRPARANIRPARAGDGAALGGLWTELDRLHAELHPGFFRPAPRSPDYLSRLLGDVHAAVLVAVQGDEVLGCITMRIYDTPEQALYRPRRRVQLDDLVVSPGARRRGLGRALMAAAERWAAQRGAEQVVLTVWRGNPAAASLYRQRGYGAVHEVLALELDGGPARRS